MIPQVTVTITVPADRLADLQAFCMEQAIAPAPKSHADLKKPAAARKKPGPKPGKKRAKKVVEEPVVDEPVEESKGPTRDELRQAISTAIDDYGEAPVKEVFAKHKVRKFSDIKDSQMGAMLDDILLLATLASETEDTGVDLD